MERKQFTFYRSYYEAVKELPKKEQCAVILAICAYALDEKEPELTGTAKAIFSLVRPTLDSSRRKAESGKAGGKGKQTESKTEANDKQTAREKENKKENKNKKENECCYPLPPEAPTLPEPDVASVFSDFLNRVNPSASQRCLDELAGYVRVMGPAVCKRAIDIALDNKKATWSYIKAILADKQARGVRCLADWDNLEKEREERNAATVRGNSGGKAGAGTDKQWNLKSVFDD